MVIMERLAGLDLQAFMAHRAQRHKFLVQRASQAQQVIVVALPFLRAVMTGAKGSSTPRFLLPLKLCRWFGKARRHRATRFPWCSGYACAFLLCFL
jgi:hypothetical protein